MTPNGSHPAHKSRKLIIIESFFKLISRTSDRFVLDIIGKADIYTVAAMSVYFEFFYLSFVILLASLILKIFVSFSNRALLPHIFISFVLLLTVFNAIRF